MIQVVLYLCCYRSLESPKNRVRDHLSLIRGCIPVQLSMDELLVLARHFKAIVSTVYILILLARWYILQTSLNITCSPILLALLSIML